MKTLRLLAPILLAPALFLTGCEDRETPAEEVAESELRAEAAEAADRNEFVTRVRQDLDTLQLEIRELESALGDEAQEARKELGQVQREMALTRQRLQDLSNATEDEFEKIREDVLERVDQIHEDYDEVKARIRTGEVGQAEGES